MLKRSVMLALIILLAGILRFYSLGRIPVSLEWDEVAIGYDAYSILKTGRDQFGKFLPLTFRSLDDYKPPIYEYLTVPAIQIFGLNSFSVRFPSALFGLLSVIVTYYLALYIFKEVPALKLKSYRLALISTFLLSISPWHLQFSRAAFEVNISVLITITAIASFINGLKKPKYFLLAAFLFGINLFSYHSTRVVTPLLLLSLFLLFNKKLPSAKYLLAFSGIFGIFFLSFIPILLSADAQIRFKATNIFSPGARYLDEKDLDKIYLEERLKDKSAGFETAGKIYHNPRFIYFDYDTLRKALNHYLSHFNFEFLFIKGDAPLHHAPGFGLLYIWELPFLIAGLIYLVRKNLNRYVLIILLWMLIAPIPVAVTREAPHAVRAELILPTFQFITAVGLIVIIEFIKKESRWVYCPFFIFAVLFLTINNSYYLHQYYIHTNYELSQNWLYGRKEAVFLTEKIKNNYDKILVSKKVDMPHIFWLFYTQYSPQRYLSEGGTVSGGFADERNRFDKYEFRNFSYKLLPKDKKFLLVGLPNEFPPEATILQTIFYLDGTEALKIAENI